MGAGLPNKHTWKGHSMPQMNARAPMVMLLAVTLLTGCASSGAGDGCAAWRAIRVAPADVLTPETARDVLAHNLTGQRLGCW